MYRNHMRLIHILQPILLDFLFIGLTECNPVEPQESPSEELYHKMHHHLQSIDIATTSVGDILLDCFDIGAQWYNGVNMATCDADIADKVVEYLRPAVAK